MHEEIYRQRILDHYKNPRRFGKIKGATHAYGYNNVSCGDQLQFQVKVVKSKIKDIGFTGSGCAVSMAAASLTVEYLLDKTLSTIKKMTKKDTEKLLQIKITAAREDCALLALQTLKLLQPINKKRIPEGRHPL